MLAGSAQRGLALILVLWLLAALGLVMLGVVSTSRFESRQSHAELQRSKALLAAEGAVSHTVLQLLRHSQQFPRNGQVVHLTQDDVQLSLSVRSEHGKLDLNFGHPDHFASLFRYLGASASETQTLVAQLIEQRSTGQPLRQMEELLAVTSMDTALYQRILPYVTLWGGDRVPMATYADPVLVEALDLPALATFMSHSGSVLSIDVLATLADGASAGVRATVLLTPQDSEAGVFRILHWSER